MSERSRKEDGQKLELPLVYSVDTVIPIGFAVSLTIATAMCRAAVESAVANGDTVFASLLRSLGEPGEAGLDVHDIGTVASIAHRERLPDGSERIVLIGRSRAKIRKQHFKGSYLSASIEMLNAHAPENMGPKKAKELSIALQLLKSSFDTLAANDKKIGEEGKRRVAELGSTDDAIDAIMSFLPIRAEAKQDVFATLDPLARAIKATAAVDAELERLSLQRRIAAKVRRRIDKNQREYYLREQLKEIHDELGKDQADPELDELEARLRERVSSPEALAKALREMARLKRIPPMSPEAAVLRSYLDWLSDLPWSPKSGNTLDISEAEAILDRNHHGMRKPKQRVLEFIAVRELADRVKGPILCFVGPPGTGKTSLGRSVSEALGLDFVRVSLGGIRDEAEIRGHRKTYVGALPGKILQGMRKAGSVNPVFLLDEIDKVSNDYHGDPSSALLEVLDPEQNAFFGDHYLEVPYDLSQVFFIATANSAGGIPYPLLDRMEIIEIPGYTELEKLEISKRFLVPKALDQAGLPKDSVRYEDAALFEIIRHYTMESGVRSLEREIQRTARKIAQRAVSEGCAKDKAKLLSFSHEITIEGLKALLGPRKIEEPSLEATVASSRCGIVNALAWTEVGGTVLTVESTIFEGTGELILTGNLGDVMKESARAALSYIRSSADLLGIDSDRFAKANVHVHVPSGAIPKDGPSAGMAIASSLVSTLTAKPAARGFAMTGEITISGRILPIGGLKEKALAAVRRGLSDIIIPAANAKDVEELPNEVLSSLRVHFVESIDDTLALVFPSKKNRGIAHSSDRQGKAVKPSPDGPRGTRKRK